MTEDELVDTFNELGERIGTVSREEAERDNHIIRNVIVFIFNSAGKVWIQKRPENKTFGGKWDASTCGAVKKGEEPEVAAIREQEEEMGFVSELHLVESFINQSVSNDGSKPRSFLTKLFIGRDDRIPQPNEDVDEFAAHDPGELQKLIQNNSSDYVSTLGIELEKALAHLQL